MKINTFWVVTLAIAAANCVNDVKENSRIEIEAFSSDKMSFRGLSFGVGTDNQKNPSTASFALNFGLKTSIVGSKEKAGWGISCDASTDNSCHITNDAKYPIFYFSKMLDAQSAELYLRPIAASSVNVKEPKVDKMPINLVVGGNSWVAKDFGILGLSPSGHFSKYLTQLYGEKADIVFKFKLGDASVPNDELSYNLFAYLNPLYSDNDVIREFVLDENAGSWYSKANIDFISPAWSFEDKRVCFNTDDLLIQVDDSTDRCDAVKKLVCNGKIGPDCVRSIADFSKAPKLSIDLDGTKFDFNPEEYLYYNKDVVDCRFGDTGDLRVNGSCDEDTQLGLGKLFLQKNIPVFKFRYGGKSSIVLLKDFNAPDDKPSNRFIWLIVGGISAVIALIVIISIILKKKQESDEDYYPAYQTAL
jgi:hypothetical protein